MIFGFNQNKPDVLRNILQICDVVARGFYIYFTKSPFWVGCVDYLISYVENKKKKKKHEKAQIQAIILMKYIYIQYICMIYIQKFTLLFLCFTLMTFDRFATEICSKRLTCFSFSPA
jgi:hypothetical protein